MLITKLIDAIKPKPRRVYTSFARTKYRERQMALSKGAESSSTAWERLTWKEILDKDDEVWNYFAVTLDDIKPIGNWSEPRQIGQIIKRYRAAGESCKLLRPITIERTQYLGDFCKITPGYFSETIEKLCGEGDYCHYCGEFNGPNGEKRLGWDCCYCGCN